MLLCKSEDYEMFLSDYDTEENYSIVDEVTEALADEGQEVEITAEILDKIKSDIDEQLNEDTVKAGHLVCYADGTHAGVFPISVTYLIMQCNRDKERGEVEDGKFCGPALGELHRGFYSVGTGVIVKIDDDFKRIPDLYDKYKGKYVALVDETHGPEQSPMTLMFKHELIAYIHGMLMDESFDGIGQFIFDISDKSSYLSGNTEEDIVKNSKTCLVNLIQESNF